MDWIDLDGASNQPQDPFNQIAYQIISILVSLSLMTFMVLMCAELEPNDPTFFDAVIWGKVTSRKQLEKEKKGRRRKSGSAEEEEIGSYDDDDDEEEVEVEKPRDRPVSPLWDYALDEHRLIPEAPAAPRRPDHQIILRDPEWVKLRADKWPPAELPPPSKATFWVASIQLLFNVRPFRTLVLE